MMFLLGYFYSGIISFLHKFYRKRQGITSTEYGLMGAAVAVFVVSVLYGDYTFVAKLKEKFHFLSNLISNAILTFK